MKLTSIEKKMIAAIVVVGMIFCVSVYFLAKSLEQAGKEVEKHGLKGIAESVWYGKDKK